MYFPAQTLKPGYGPVIYVHWKFVSKTKRRNSQGILDFVKMCTNSTLPSTLPCQRDAHRKLLCKRSWGTVARKASGDWCHCNSI